jgi:hypothetical protein
MTRPGHGGNPKVAMTETHSDTDVPGGHRPLTLASSLGTAGALTASGMPPEALRTRTPGLSRLATFVPHAANYARGRNLAIPPYAAVSRLSPYIRHQWCWSARSWPRSGRRTRSRPWTKQIRRRVVRWFAHRRLLDSDDARDMLTWEHGGFSLDASVCIAGSDRPGLERLLRYCARSPFALARIEQVNEDRIVYRPPEPQRDGRTVLSLTPLELIDHLAAAPGDPRPWRRPALFPTRRSPRAKGHWTFARGSPQRTVARRRHRLPARCGSRRRAASGQSPCLPRRRSHQAPPLSALPVGRAHRPSVPHPAARLPRLRRRHAHHRLHHRDRSRAADSQQHRRARRPAADSRDGGGRAASGTAAEDQPGPRTARLGRPAGRCRTRLGGPGATVTRVCLRPEVPW